MWPHQQLEGSILGDFRLVHKNHQQHQEDLVESADAVVAAAAVMVEEDVTPLSLRPLRLHMMNNRRRRRRRRVVPFHHCY